MRLFSLVLFATIANLAIAQETFYDLYNSILKLHDHYAAIKKSNDIGRNRDSTLIMERNSAEFQSLFTDIEKLSQRTTNLNFPDIMFTDINEVPYNISDLEGELVINCNYPYCMNCINRIDSTQKRTDRKKVKILVLFLDIYKKDISFLKTFNEHVLVGFISPDAKDLISLTLGADCMYFLDTNHRIEFFDVGNDKKWTDFLDKKMN